MSSSNARAYLVGDPINSEFFGNELSPKFLMLQKLNGRVSLHFFYLDHKVKPISKVKTIIPESSESPYPIFGATVAFHPKFFDGY